MSITEPLLHVVVDRERDGRADGVLHEIEGDAPLRVGVFAVSPCGSFNEESIRGARGGLRDAVLRGLHHDGRRNISDAST